MAAKVENNIVFYFPNIYMIGMIMEIPKQNNIKKKENRIKKSRKYIATIKTIEQLL